MKYPLKVDDHQHCHGIDGSLNGPWYAGIIDQNRDTVCIVPARRRCDYEDAVQRAQQVADAMNAEHTDGHADDDASHNIQGFDVRRIEDLASVRVLLIAARDLLNPVDEKLAGVGFDDNPIGGGPRSYLRNAKSLLHQVCEYVVREQSQEADDEDCTTRNSTFGTQ